MNYPNKFYPKYLKLSELFDILFKQPELLSI